MFSCRDTLQHYDFSEGRFIGRGLTLGTNDGNISAALIASACHGCREVGGMNQATPIFRDLIFQSKEICMNIEGGQAVGCTQ